MFAADVDVRVVTDLWAGALGALLGGAVVLVVGAWNARRLARVLADRAARAALEEAAAVLASGAGASAGPEVARLLANGRSPLAAPRANRAIDDALVAWRTYLADPTAEASADAVRAVSHALEAAGGPPLVEHGAR